MSGEHGGQNTYRDLESIRQDTTIRHIFQWCSSDMSMWQNQARFL